MLCILLVHVDMYSPCACRHNVVCTGKKKKVQTDPPSIPVAELLPGGVAPEGEWQSYKNE